MDNRTFREHDVTTLPPISISRQHRACVTCPSALCCCGYSSCVHGSLRSVIHHLYLSAAVVCDRSTLTVDGNVKIVRNKHHYLNCITISDVSCFFPETHPRNLDIRQHTGNTNNITIPPSSTCSSGPHHEHVAGPRCIAVASCSVEGCDRSSTASLLMCCACVWGVSRVSCAPRKIRV